MGCMLKQFWMDCRDLRIKFAKLSRAVAHWRKKELSRSFMKMVDNVILVANTKRALNRWRNASLLKAVRSWKDVVKKKQRALGHWMNVTLARVRCRHSCRRLLPLQNARRNGDARM